MFKKITLLLIIILSLNSCLANSSEIVYNDIIEKIEKPNNSNLLVSGSYETVEMIELTDINEDVWEKYEKPPKLYISNGFIKFADMYSISPNFKSRFLNYKNLLAMSNLNLEEELNKNEGPVLTVSDGQFYYQNILVLNENQVAIINDGILFKLEKISDDVPDKVIEDTLAISSEDSDRVQASDLEESIEENYAVFLGLKSPQKDEYGNSYYDYYTIMISDKLGGLVTYGIKNLFVPSKLGVHLTGIDHSISDKQFKDSFFYELISNDSSEKIYTEIGEGAANTILYIGNGYISIETKEFDSASRKYRFYDVQKLEKDEALSITDIAGENGLKSFVDDTAKTINKHNIEATAIDLIDRYSLGMVRNNGKWEFKSNLMITEDDKLVVTDYLLNIVPTIDLNSQNLALPWEDIKMKFPNVIDAYSSLEGSILIIQNPRELMVYSVNNGLIGDEPLISVGAGEYDRVIMAEWVSGSLVNEWFDLFMKQERLPLQTME